MKEETLSKLSEVLCHAFHRQKWVSVDDDGEGCDENRLAWKNCALAVIKAYEKDKWSQVGYGNSI